MTIDVILRYSPRQARKAWLVINSFILTWSLLLLLDLFWTKSPERRLQGTHAYLMYSFISTCIWVVEVGLHLLDYHRLRQEQRQQDEALQHGSSSNSSRGSSVPPNPHMLFHNVYSLISELIIALYFLIDSIRDFIEWGEPDSNVGAEVLDTVINIAAYLYQIVRVIQMGECNVEEASSLPMSNESDCNEDYYYKDMAMQETKIPR
eukprot:scaffold24012_cov186-Cylindrotheca_fusiformis.AAC.4